MKTGKIAPQNVTASKAAEANASKEITATRAISNTTGGGATDLLDRDGVQAELAAGVVMREPDEYVRVFQSLATTVTIDAGLLHLYDSNGKLYQTTGFSGGETANITLSGAGGLDTGVEAASTWYYIWAIGDGNGVNDAAMLSTSYNNPTMPGSYTYKRLVGAVYNDASSNFIDFKQRGNVVEYGEERNIISGSLTTSAWTTMGSAFGNMTPGFINATRIKIIARGGSISGVSTVSSGWYGSYAQADGSAATTWGLFANSKSIAHVHEVGLHSATGYYYTNNAAAEFCCIGYTLDLGLE